MSLGRGGQLGDAGLQQGRDLGIVPMNRMGEGRVSVVVAVQGIGPVLQQEADASHVALQGRDEEGRGSLLGWQVDRGSLPQQEGHDLGVVVLRCHVQRARAAIASRVDLGPVLKQEPRHSRVAKLGRDEEGRGSLVG